MSDSELLGDTGVRWSAESIYKAERLVADGKVSVDVRHPQVFWVQGSAPHKYRVQTDGKTWLTCTCPNGQRTSRPSCYHSAAALMVLVQGESS
jgi:uncharacterized Zn finger protein